MEDKTSVYIGIQSLALALIFAPEPFTTPFGLVLLVYANHMKRHQHVVARRRTGHKFYSYYSFKVNMVHGKAVTFQTYTTRHGQLPLSSHNTTSLYHAPGLWESYQKASARFTKQDILTTRGQQPAGLLKRPVNSNARVRPARHVYNLSHKDNILGR